MTFKNDEFVNLIKDNEDDEKLPSTKNLIKKKK